MRASLQRGEATLAKWMEREGEDWGDGGAGCLMEKRHGLTLRFPIVSWAEELEVTKWLTHRW